MKNKLIALTSSTQEEKNSKFKICAIAFGCNANRTF
jgi:hypothetical protein